MIGDNIEVKRRKWTVIDPTGGEAMKIVYSVKMTHYGGQYSKVEYDSDYGGRGSFKIKDCGITWKTLLYAHRQVYNDAIEHFDAWHSIECEKSM